MAALGGARTMAWRHVFVLAVVFLLLGSASIVVAHPLGNFSINHYAAIRVGRDEITIRYVVDMAEIATFQEITSATGGVSTSWSAAERAAYLARTTASYVQGLKLTIDGARVPLRLLATSIATPPGLGGQPTMRITSDIAGSIDTLRDGARCSFEDTNHVGRSGWHELMVGAEDGIRIFDSSAFTSGLSDELRSYPSDVLIAPLQERSAEWSVTSGSLPGGATPASPRLAAPVEMRNRGERFAARLRPSTLDTELAFLGTLVAFALGGLRALLWRKRIAPDVPPPPLVTAMLQSLQVTVTEISGVVPLALVAFVVAEYVVPAQLHRTVDLAGGGVLCLLGGSLVVRRPRERSSLLAVVLAGCTFHRVGYGFALIGAFSLGVLAMLVAGHLQPSDAARDGLPAATRFSVLAQAVIVTVTGAVIFVAALLRV